MNFQEAAARRGAAAVCAPWPMRAMNSAAYRRAAGRALSGRAGLRARGRRRLRWRRACRESRAGGSGGDRAAALVDLGSAGALAALFFGAALLLPPLPIAIGDSGPHPRLLFAALGLFAGVLWLRDWRIDSHLNGALLVALFGVMLASVAMAAFRSGRRIAAAAARRACCCSASRSTCSSTAPTGRARERAECRAAALLGGGRGGALRLRGFLLPVSGARGIRSAVRLARFRRLPPRAGPVLRGQHAGQLLRVLPGDDRGGFTRPREESPVSRKALAAGGAVFFAALVLSYSRASLLNLWRRGWC